MSVRGEESWVTEKVEKEIDDGSASERRYSKTHHEERCQGCTWGWKLFLRFYGGVRALGVTLTELLGLWRITERDGKSSECLSFLWKCSIGYGRVHGVHGSALCQKAVWKG